MLKKLFISASFIILFFTSSESYSFMSGVKPELDGGQALEIVDGVIHQGPPSSSVNVAYGILRNNTSEDITLTVFRSPVFDDLQMHNMEYSANGTAKMIHLKNISVPAKNDLALKPGGHHLMLINKRRDLILDENIMVVVIAADSVRYMLNFKVIDPRLENNSN
jgi:copper(I)-binding protein